MLAAVFLGTSRQFIIIDLSYPLRDEIYMYRHTVPRGVAPTPIVRYLNRAFPMLPKWLVRDALNNKDIRINNLRIDSNAVVQYGDELTFFMSERYFDFSLKIIYEDYDLVAVEKPAGIPVDEDRENIGADTMINRLRNVYPKIELCHRLDVGTGGVLMAARNADALAEITNAFRRHEITKHYQCLVVGTPVKADAQLTAYLIKDAKNARVLVCDVARSGALPIETHYHLLGSTDQISLLDVTLVTGRTHQIRAHLSHIGLPILGDDKYGNREINRRMKRTYPALWCSSVTWKTHVFRSEPPFCLFNL